MQIAVESSKMQIRSATKIKYSHLGADDDFKPIKLADMQDGGFEMYGRR